MLFLSSRNIINWQYISQINFRELRIVLCIWYNSIFFKETKRKHKYIIDRKVTYKQQLNTVILIYKSILKLCELKEVIRLIAEGST